MYAMTWPDLETVLRTGSTYLISSHVNPDGDCIGSQLAMSWLLGSYGKDVVIYNRDPVPYKMAFLSGVASITTVKPERTFDTLVVLDSSNLDRLGWEGADRIGTTILNIDHHRDNTRFGDHNFVCHAAATGQILYNLFKEGRVEYPACVAEALYTAILTDTGGFRFSNTSSDVLHICADLADRGAEPAIIYERAYASCSRNGMRLHAAVWPSLAFHLNGKVCTMDLPLRLIDELGATYGDSEGLADLTVMATEVQVGLFIKHSDHETHFSLRSKSTIDVGRIARMVPGGGGHVNAAGCTMPSPISSALPQMLAIVEKELA
jgi:bifunctional oligoribonuclease and PAP phosphatase NrnA